MKLEIPQFSTGKVLVVGDLMLDKYWRGDTKRISPEAPVPIVKIDNFNHKAGGAANVALNMATLGTQVTIAGIMGVDQNAEILSSLLNNSSIDNQAIQLENIHTITKLRVLSNNQQLIRLDFEDPLYSIDKTSFTEHIKTLIPQYDVLLISDYDKGTLSNVEELIIFANEQNIPVLVDPKGNDFTRYQGASVITPNLSELEQIIGINTDENTLIDKTNALLTTLNLGAILITRSEAGMTLVKADTPSLYLPAKAQEVYDVTGAGDTVIATLASCLAVNGQLENACQLANVAAGIVVEKSGTAVVTAMELYQAVHISHQFNSTLLTVKQLSILLAQIEYRRQKATLIYGCFDILTASHVAFIKKMKAQIQHLIIAITTKDMAFNTKTKVVNDLDRRIAVISALENVDWVVPVNSNDLRDLKEHQHFISCINADEHPEIESFSITAL